MAQSQPNRFGMMGGMMGGHGGMMGR